MIDKILNLSFRHKIPLWGAFLIISSTLIMSVILTYRNYNELEDSVLTSAQSLGFTLAKTLVPTLLHDDVWRAFEIIKAPFSHSSSQNPLQVESILITSLDNKIFTSAHPGKYPILSKVENFYPDLVAELNNKPLQKVAIIEPDNSSVYFVVIPIMDNKTHLATLILLYSRTALNQVYLNNAISSFLIGLIVLAVLLPINWYWGQHLAIPLIKLTQRMDNIPDKLPNDKIKIPYKYNDELGHLFDAYYRMIQSLHEKALLEQGIVKAERLAVVGRLTASIAHEINNPLAGMLTALDTLKQRDKLEPPTLKTLGLLERGLIQVSNTVSALLVEARQEKRDLSKQDIEDIKNLILPMVHKSELDLEVSINMPDTLPLPSSSIRQILMNLINNAVQSSPKGNYISYKVYHRDKDLFIEVINSGSSISAQQMHNLFEPFISYREGGHGLGLWVTYQLVSQMNGKIEVESANNQVRFMVTIPIFSYEVKG